MKFKLSIALFLIFEICIFIFQFHWLFNLLTFILFTCIVALGAINIQWNFFIKSKNSLLDFNINSKSIALTFDDGIHPMYTKEILDILIKHQIRATFFLIGKNIEGNEAILRRMYHEGHTIGNHSLLHSFWFDMQSSKKILLEIEKVNELIETNLGSKPTLFRPPYGVTNPNVAKAIKQSGMQSVGWNVRSMDTVAKSKEQLLIKLKQKTISNTIVLLHDRCAITVEALTDYIAFCKEQGFTFVALK